MKKNLLNRNIVLKKSGLVANSIPLDSLKDAILAVFPGQPDPIINKLPDIIIFILPDRQFSVTIQNETIVIADDPQKESGNLNELIKVAIRLDEILDEYTLTAFGINHRFMCEDVTSIDNVFKYFNSQQMLTESLASSPSILNYSFLDKQGENLRTQYTIAALVDVHGDYSSNLEVNINVHKDETEGGKLPDFETLKGQFESHEDKHSEFLVKLTGEDES